MRLFGRNSVLERIRSNPSSIKMIYVQKGLAGTGELQKKARAKNIVINPIIAARMHKVARGKNAQGVMADVDNFAYEHYNDILEHALKKGRTLIFLDNITDPQNLGSLIRSLACLGKFSLILPTHDSVSVTETVLRIASGGENYVPIAQVANINKAIRKAKDEGFWIAGTVVGGEHSIMDAEFKYPLGIVVGSEQKGIRDIIRKNLDMELTIPMPIETMSFNVAHATSIVCYEITRRKAEYRKS